MLSNSEQTGNEDARADAVEKPVRITPEEFYRGVAVGVPDGVQAVVTWGPSEQPNDHTWSNPGGDVAKHLAEASAGKTPAYFSMAAYHPDTVSRWKGRTQGNVVAVRGFWIDIEGSAKKYAKPGGEDGGLTLPLFSALHRLPIMRTSCLAAGPRSSFAQTSSG